MVMLAPVRKPDSHGQRSLNTWLAAMVVVELSVVWMRRGLRQIWFSMLLWDDCGSGPRGRTKC